MYNCILMGKYKKNKHRIKSGPEHRNKEERIHEVKRIITKLTELELSICYEPIKELYVIMKAYIEIGDRKVFNIPFPMINRTIKGVLAISIREKCCIKLILVN
jgi:hypothetical protein